MRERGALHLGAFRVDVARAGASDETKALVDELCEQSPEFKAMCREQDVQDPHGDGLKRIRHPVLGPLTFAYSAFAVDGRPNLSMVVYDPVAPSDLNRINSLIEERRHLEPQSDGAESRNTA